MSYEGPKVKHFAAKGNKKAVGVPDDLAVIWNDIIGDEKETAWVLCAYDSGGKNLEITSSGNGGLSEFKAGLGDQLAWGAFRCTAVDDREVRVCQLSCIALSMTFVYWNKMRLDT
jgi:hypothetical protein